MTDFRWVPVEKDPEETLSRVLSLFGLCANFWDPNEEYALGDFVWPIIEDENGEVSGNGYCYECTQAGRSGSTQPLWNLIADQVLTKLDGSAQWICRVPTGTSGISAASAPVAYPPAGLTVPGLVVNEGTKLVVDYAGGADGEDYDVKFTFLIAGRLRVGRQTVQVRLR